MLAWRRLYRSDSLHHLAPEDGPLLHERGIATAIDFRADGGMTGAACWRADGTPLGIGGGLARKGTHFFTDPRGIAARAAAKA